MTRFPLILAALALPGCAIIAELPAPVAGHWDKHETTAVPAEDIEEAVTEAITTIIDGLWREPGCPEEWCGPDSPDAPDPAPAAPPAPPEPTDPPDLGPPDSGPDNGGAPDVGTPGGGMGPGPGNGGGMVGGGND